MWKDTLRLCGTGYFEVEGVEDTSRLVTSRLFTSRLHEGGYFEDVSRRILRGWYEG